MSPLGDGRTVEATYVYSKEDFGESGRFYLHPGQFPMEVPGPGKLVNVLVMAQSDDFRVSIRSARADIVSDTFTELADISDSLAHVSAFESDGVRTVAVEDYHFVDSLVVEVAAMDTVTFDRVRAEFQIEEVL